MAKYRSTGEITAADYKHCKYVGKTKGGAALTIDIPCALNMGNVDWTFADKDDTVAEIVLTAVYDNTDEAAKSKEAPYTIEIGGEIQKGAAEIMTGVGLFYIEDTPVALTRGGGKFSAEREFREIGADGDRGPVKDRIVIDRERATLTMNTLQILTNIAELYPAMEKITE